MADDIRIPVDVTGAAEGAADLEDLADAARDAADDLDKLSTTDVDVAGANQMAQALDDVRTAGQKAAAEIADMAATMDADLTDARSAADALARAMGPELAATVNMDQVLAQLRDMGLTMDDVRNEADPLAASLKSLADVKISAQAIGLDSMGGALKSARAETDQLAASAGSSRSVLANMVGNTTQDLGALTGVAGSAGVAIGQMGEYMADAVGSGDKLGDILKNFGTVAAPVAALATVTFAIGEWQKQMAKARQEAADLLAAQKALGAGDTGAWVSELVTQYGSLVGALGDAGVSMSEFRAIVEEGPAAVDALKARLEEAGTSTLLLGDGALTAGGQLDQLATVFGENETKLKAQDEATRAVAEAYGLLVTSTGELVPAEEAVATGVDVVTQAMDAQAEKTRAATAAFQEQRDAMRAAADARFALTKAEDDWLDTADTYQASLDAIAQGAGTAEQKQRDMAVVTNDATQQAIAMADAARDVAAEQAAANGTTLSAADSTKVWAGRMIDAASNASGPLRQSILDYTASVLGIPPEVVSDVAADLDEQSVEEAKTKITDAAADQDSLIAVAQVGASLADTQISNAARDRDTTISVGVALSNAAQVVIDMLTGKRSTTIPVSSAPSSSVSLSVAGNIYGDRALTQTLTAWERDIARELDLGPR